MREFKLYIHPKHQFPGTPVHQAILRIIVDYYKRDLRIQAVAVFGSLGRGNWDSVSDVDLDVVVADQVQVNVMDELQSLAPAFEATGEVIALVLPESTEEADVLFESLNMLSIRFHPLTTTSPNIVDSLLVLASRIDPDSITTAGLANRPEAVKPLQQVLDECVYYAAYTTVGLKRSQPWTAIEALELTRSWMMELYTRTHGGERPLKFFQAHAETDLQERLGATLPQYNIESHQRSLLRCVEILGQDLERLSNGQIYLTDAHRKILKKVIDQAADF